ncbi:methylmalonyl-CoA epimerase (plasmid) [Microbacterium sp. No. 7]|nr:methylmalonyl-CoA epimerase [Microbacterium sp. No. 7]
MSMASLVQVAQRAVDLERATAFYSALLGSAPVARFDPPGLVFFDLDGVRLLLESAAPSALLYLRVDDLESAVDRAGDVEIVSPGRPIFTHTTDELGPAGREEWQAFIRDPEGNLVGLVAFREPAETKY